MSENQFVVLLNNSFIGLIIY